MPNYTYPYTQGLPSGANPAAILAAAIPGLIIGLVFLVFALWLYGRILHKAGYSGWLALLTIIPLVNLIFIIWFAFATWPVERRAAGMGAPQAAAGYYPPAAPAAPMQQPGYGQPAAPAQQPGYGQPAAPAQAPAYVPPQAPQPPVPQPPVPQPPEQPAPQPPQQPGGYTPPPPAQ